MLDLFSGIGGFSLAASWVWGDELEIVSFCEIDKFCQKVLNKHWPDVPIHDDIKTLKGDQFGEIDIICGGDPCQANSIAGLRKGSDDKRWLWPEYFRIIRESKPRWVIRENVVNSRRMDADNVLADLESIGYKTRIFDIPACACGLYTLERHLWFVAASDSKRCERSVGKTISRQPTFSWKFPRGDQGGQERWSIPASRVFGVAERIPDRVDRIKSLGNAIVPQVAAKIMFAIKKVMDNGNS